MTAVTDAYELGQLVRIGPETFTDFTGNPVDPTTVSVSIKKPDGTIDGPFTLAATQVVREALGVFHYDYTPATTGHYLYRWVTTGTATTAAVGNFDVQDSFAPAPILTGARQRVLQGAPATLRVTLADQDGTAVNAAGALTVAVTRADGTVLVPAGTATSHGLTGAYSVALTAAQTAVLDELTAVWTDAGDGSTTTTVHEIVGGFFFTIADARNSNDGLLADPVVYPDAKILEKRQQVEDEAEEICDVAFVPRYARVTLDGDGSPDLLLAHNRIRTVRSVRVYPYKGASTYTALSQAQLAGLVVDNLGKLTRTDFAVFAQGRGNVVVEYEHGYDQPQADLREAALVRLRSRLNKQKSAVDERATSFTAENGQTFKLSTAEAYKTGIPEVDAAYGRYSLRSSADTPRAVSMPLNFDPQLHSVFHGGRR